MSDAAGRTKGSAGAVRLRRDGAVAFITFDRPRVRNAMTRTMYGELDRILEGLEGEDGLRAVVLRGAGGTFVSGTDIAHFADFRSGEDGVAYERYLDRVLDRLEALPFPTLAVVEGVAAGGGLALAAACDLRICTPDARFGMPIARTLGNCLSLGNYARLVHHLGPGRTKALLFLADFLDAPAAREAGFVLEVVEPGEVDARVDEVCRRLATHAPITLQVTKEALRRLATADPGDGDDLTHRAYGSEDFRRGVRAFLEKKTPGWEGR